ncbi:hypothetical protein ACFY5J_25400 [Peribacillus butanolivorans]
MTYFNNLSKQEFNAELEKYVQESSFKEIFDISPLEYDSGYYILVLDEYCQVYIGKTSNMKRRIMNHWSRQKEFDRLYFGSLETSRLSIDSFRALDTTRIFVSLTKDINDEDIMIDSFDDKYILNRTLGNLTSLSDAILFRKPRVLTSED